jgi:predicted DNA-binding protein (UPF0251 family)
MRAAVAAGTVAGRETRISVPRPRKRRILERTPRAAVYKPAGIPLDALHSILLLQEELEALRLADLNGLTQAKAATQMGISRSTFQRIVARARHQVARAMVEGHALQIEGGTFQVRSPRPRGPRRRDRASNHDAR